MPDFIHIFPPSFGAVNRPPRSNRFATRAPSTAAAGSSPIWWWGPSGAGRHRRSWHVRGPGLPFERIDSTAPDHGHRPSSRITSARCPPHVA